MLFDARRYGNEGAAEPVTYGTRLTTTLADTQFQSEQNGGRGHQMD